MVKEGEEKRGEVEKGGQGGDKRGEGKEGKELKKGGYRREMKREEE